MENKELNSSKPSIDENENEDEKTMRLVDVPLSNENDALRCLVSFLNLAQRRGIFAIDESSKIWECIQIFQRNSRNMGDDTNV